ncbi:UDP-N-acetylmuramoyl-tripeptide--D-alanyl-D-alanine ligase [Candidatus Gracilibacteria bacterium]|nr:UDP-N-acetylmuramoyl-tripeptide--D-alanyl-D-alanine ligase [Candidatus Gracilibacteria bacterium]
MFLFFAIAITLSLVEAQKKKVYQSASELSHSSNMIRIGITGSYGKSSVKEYLAAILSSQHETLKTPDNINSEIGASQFINNSFSGSKAQYFVCEMGAYRIGEIQDLGNIVQHQHGFLTAIGTQHMGLFGSQENIKTGKSEIALSISKNNGRLYLNFDNEFTSKLDTSHAPNAYKITYGLGDGADAQAEIQTVDEKGTSFVYTYQNQVYNFQTNLIGSAHICNLSGALAFCFDEGMTYKQIQGALKSLPLPNHTLTIIKSGDLTLIDDSYNLSQESLVSGVEILQYFSGNTYIILDDVLELGRNSAQIHKELGEKIAQDIRGYYILYVGRNYKKEFLAGLTAGGFSEKNILGELPELIGKNTLLFEGRETQKLLNKYLGSK